MPEVCCRISQPELRRHRSFVEDGLLLAVIGWCALINRLGGEAKEECRRVKVNFTFENFEVQDEVSLHCSWDFKTFTIVQANSWDFEYFA